MKKKGIFTTDFLSNKQEKLFSYEQYFNLFIRLYKNDLLPNNILLSGQSGLGKATFAYHFINFILSDKEDYSYDFKNFTINPLNKSFRLINKHYHPNFYLLENFADKRSISIKQVRDMVNYLNKTNFEKINKFILIDNVEYLNLHSVNALLKIIEEPNLNTFLILIHNSSIKLAETLKSRCVEFKIFFSNQEKKKILENLLIYFNLKIDINLLEKIKSFYDSPGIILNLVKLINEASIDLSNPNLINIISNLMEFNFKE
tara:strand:- start:386 stop:1162 length:777 start_codon:yes stop_codon:yes gene_type:complete